MKSEKTAEILLAADGTEHARPEEIFYRLAKWCIYGDGPCGGQTVYDALVARRVYCKGLSKAYQLLMQNAGIPCRIVSGSLWGQGRHVWNEIQINGQWVEADLSSVYPEIRDMMRTPVPVFGVKTTELPDCYRAEQE